MTFYFNLVSLFTLLISVRCLQILGFCPAFSSVRQALLSSLKSYYSDCSSAKFIILALNLKSCTSNIYLTLNEQTRIAPPSAPVCPDMSIRPRPGYLTSWPLSNSPFKSDLCLFPRLLVFLSHRQINELVINPESFLFLFLRVTIFWPREKKRNWFHSWPMRRAETCFWKRENKNVSRQRKTWIHDFRLLNIPRIQTRTVNRYYRTGLIASLTNRDPRTVPGFNG